MIFLYTWHRIEQTLDLQRKGHGFKMERRLGEEERGTGRHGASCPEQIDKGECTGEDLGGDEHHGQQFSSGARRRKKRGGKVASPPHGPYIVVEVPPVW